MKKTDASPLSLVLEGFIHARKLGLTKEYDVALSIVTTLLRDHKLISKSAREKEMDVARERRGS